MRPVSLVGLVLEGEELADELEGRLNACVVESLCAHVADAGNLMEVYESCISHT